VKESQKGVILNTKNVYSKSRIAVMRNNDKLERALLYILIVVLSISCKEEIPPIVITSDVTNVSATTAKSGGKIISEGTSTIQQRGVCWSISPDPTINDVLTLDGEGPGDFTSSVTGLTGATTYYVRAYAANSSGVGYGKPVEFSTLGAAPAATTNPASNLTATSATLNAFVSSNYLLTNVTFEYGMTTSYGSSVVPSNSPFTSSSGVNINVIISDLLPHQTYHFRVKSENSQGTVYGSDLTFQTLGGAPVIEKAASSSLTKNTATLYGTVNPNLLSTSVTFEYGTTTSYELPAVVIQNPVTEMSNKVVSARLTGLAENTIYHFRIKAVNSVGTTYSNDISFETNTADFPTDGLVSYYSFQGNAIDNFGNNDGVGKFVDYIISRDNSDNLALRLNGTISYVQILNEFDFENRSINVWFNVTESKTELTVIYASDNPLIDYGMSILATQRINSQSSLVYNISGQTDTVGIALNTWYNATLVAEGKKFTFYLDGIKIKSGSFTTYVRSTSDGLQSAILGCNRTLSARFFK
jgi:hypothetical protein